jgi:hypothetical protein
VDNTTNILRLMLLLSLAIGVVLTRTLLQGKRTRWQQSPFLLTASKSEDEESEKKEVIKRKSEKESAMSTLRLLISDSYDPWFNLAVEECIFRQMPATQRVLFLWRNADTVVIGRAQNPWKECNTRRMEEDNVRPAPQQRRRRGVPRSGQYLLYLYGGKPEYDKTVSTLLC